LCANIRRTDRVTHNIAPFLITPNEQSIVPSGGL
jgi:hypothetical protein